VFDIILDADNSNVTVLASSFAILDYRRPALPSWIWSYFLGFSKRARDKAGAYTRAVEGLQSLLCLTIYHCQAKTFADLKHGLGYDNGSAVGRKILSSLPNHGASHSNLASDAETQHCRWPRELNCLYCDGWIHLAYLCDRYSTRIPLLECENGQRFNVLPDPGLRH
jgi:hypothetical protein